jgi:hypothetical protein
MLRRKELEIGRFLLTEGCAGESEPEGLAGTEPEGLAGTGAAEMGKTSVEVVAAEPAERGLGERMLGGSGEKSGLLRLSLCSSPLSLRKDASKNPRWS